MDEMLKVACQCFVFQDHSLCPKNLWAVPRYWSVHDRDSIMEGREILDPSSGGPTLLGVSRDGLILSGVR